jgi:hypothetical protein
MRWLVVFLCLACSGVSRAEEPADVAEDLARARALEASGYALMSLGTGALAACIPLGLTGGASGTTIGVAVGGNLLLLAGIPLLVMGARRKGALKKFSLSWTF